MSPDSAPLFIVNPVAGGGRGERTERVIRDLLRTPGRGRAEIVSTERPGHAVELAERGARAGHDPIIGVAGDGTLSEIANGLLRAEDRPAFGAVPIGTGNDFARSLALPTDVGAAVGVAFDPSEPKLIDVGALGDRYFLNVAGLGFDADVARTANRMPSVIRRGSIPFMAAVLLEIARKTVHPVDIYLDGRLFRRRCLMVAVANGPFYGGGMMICPDASREDGLLDVCMVGDLSRLEVLKLLPKVFSGAHVAHPKVEIHRALVVRVEGSQTTRLELDGDVVGSAPAEFRVLSGALRVVGAGRRT
jgi:YegS/Rv2252/BmrU family lipid kinase